MNNNSPNDNYPEDDFSDDDFSDDVPLDDEALGDTLPEEPSLFNHRPIGHFPSPEEWQARDLADQKRRILLSDYFAATFDESDQREAPRKENDYIEHLEELDRQIANPTMLSVRDYLGNPWVKPLAELPDDMLEDELDLLLEFMYLYGIAVDFLAEVEDREAYRFIVEELLDMETDNMSGTGMTTHFIYEEFHPNDEYDAKMWATEFLHALLRGDRDRASLWISRNDLLTPKGQPIDRRTMLAMLNHFRSRFSAVVNISLEPTACRVEGDCAVVEMATTYTGIKARQRSMTKIVGRATLWMKRDDSDDTWEVTRVRVPGWDGLAVGKDAVH